MSDPKFSVIGSGSIGIGWAIVFARAGYQVKVFDVEEAALRNFEIQVNTRLELLQENELLAESPKKVLARIHTTLDLADAVADVNYVQECGPENLEVRQELFTKLASLTRPDVILASSSSALRPSEFASDILSNERCLVVHPGNPPYLLSIAEVVPAKFTSEQSIKTCTELLTSVGIIPIRVNNEPQGFVFNRLQGAILREAYCLVRDGVISPTDLDLIVTEGLGKRWAIIGPFATSALNVRGGIKAHVARMGKSYFEMGKERGQNDPWDQNLVERVAADIENKLPDAQWERNTEKRDLALMKLNKFLGKIIKP
ncbi:MAG: 3-hydroxyacyl-CoA dehydrogenase [Actinomycetes bacterium]